MDPLENDLGGAGLPDQNRGSGWAKVTETRWEHDKGGMVKVSQIGSGPNSGRWSARITPNMGVPGEHDRFATKEGAMAFARRFVDRHPAGP